MKDPVFTIVRQRAAAYRALTDVYDQALLLAHKAGHGSPGALEQFRKANAMAPDVIVALKEYQAAVAALVWHVREPFQPQARAQRSCDTPRHPSYR